MTDHLVTAVRPAPAPPGALSPKVRRLLRDNGIEPGAVTGTGRRGRITPDDVERSARGPDHTRPRGRTGRREGRVLASPLARRLLRDHGLSPHDIAASGPITRRVVEDAISRGAAAARQDGWTTITRQVDLTRVLHAVGGAHARVQRRTGVELTTSAPIAHAVCRSLRRTPALHTSGEPPAPRDVDLAVVLDGTDGPVAPVLPCAQDLTVEGLAARLAAHRTEPDGATGAPSFALAGDGWRETPAVPAGLLPDGTATLVVDRAQQQAVTTADEFGGDTTSTRWLTTLRLSHDARRVDATTAERFLDDLTQELETVDLLAAVA